MMEKAIASGTKASATVRPDKISFFGFKPFTLSLYKCHRKIFFYGNGKASLSKWKKHTIGKTFKYLKNQSGVKKEYLRVCFP